MDAAHALHPIGDSPAIGEGAEFGWRYAAISRACEMGGQPPRSNDDGWRVVARADHLLAIVIDVATHKRGIAGAAIHAVIDGAISEASERASPAEIVVLAHARLSDELARRQARGVACLMIVRLERNGECMWAHVGDAVLLRWQPQTWCRRSRLELLTSRHRRGQGLTQCVGTRSAGGPRIEEGVSAVRPGGQLLLATDGVFHDAMTLGSIERWVEAHHRRRDTLLPLDLARKVEAEARFTQPHRDDSTLLVAERVQA